MPFFPYASSEGTISFRCPPVRIPLTPCRAQSACSPQRCEKIVLIRSVGTLLVCAFKLKLAEQAANLLAYLLVNVMKGLETLSKLERGPHQI